MQKKVCVIGYGEMGKRHSRDLGEFTQDAIAIAGVVEPSDQSYAKGCEWTGRKPKRFTSISEMLNEVQPDGCVISSPNSFHLEGLVEFTGKQIPLMLEKPLDTDIRKVRKIVDFVNAYEAPVMVHHVMRYAPIVLKAKELIDSGAIGRIAGFEMVQFLPGGNVYQNFRRTFKTGGGQLLEKATHDLDILLFMTGALPEAVAAMCKRQYHGGDKPNDLHCSNCEESSTCRHASVTPQTGNDTINSVDYCLYAKEIDIFDIEHCLIRLDNGVTGTYSECFFAECPFTRRYEFIGTDGFLSIDFSKGELFLNSLGAKQKLYFDYLRRIHYNGAPGVAKHFLGLMDGTITKVHSPVDEAFAAELIAFAAYESNRTGQFISVSDLYHKEGITCDR